MAATAGRVTWDDIGERFWETGVEKGMLYPTLDQIHSGGFTNGVSWSGLTSVTESPSGADANEKYADNIKYLNLRAAENFGFTIEAFYYPEEFGECDGTKALANGALVMRQQTRSTFGFAYVTRIGNDTIGDSYGDKLHLYWNATVSPSASQYQTVNDSPEPNTFSWEATTTPQTVGTIGGVPYRPTACVIIDVSKLTGGWNNTKLKQLTDILWGVDADVTNNITATVPRLPSVLEVISIIAPTTEAPEILLATHTVTVTAGGTATIPVLSKTPANKTITWASSSSTYATVEGRVTIDGHITGEYGAVTGVTAGSATITATITVDNVDYTDTCTVIVTSGGQTSDTQAEP